MTERARKPMERTVPRTWIGWAIAGLAFLAGLATDAIGAGHRVNVLALPMLGMMLWNLAVYALLALRRFAGVRHPRRTAPGASTALRATAGLPIAALLHLGAAMLALGMVAGLYLRGLAFEYRADWESTFLDAATVHRLLSVVLGPASALTGIALPDVDRLAALRADAGPGENAAPWIHLYAATAAVVVVVPRLLLVAWSLRGARTRGARHGVAPSADDAGPPLPALAAHARVLALPYSYRLPAQCVRGLGALVRAQCGATVQLHIAPDALPDAPDTSPKAAADDPPDLAIAVFALAATPEPQTHVAFAAALPARLPGRPRVAVLVDETAFRARFGHQPGRIAERRAAWRAALSTAGLPVSFATLGAQEAAAG